MSGEALVADLFRALARARKAVMLKAVPQPAPNDSSLIRRRSEVEKSITGHPVRVSPEACM